jgi:2-phospho-L-lactate/phosphoenolpyruvate guanylyltransferase
MTLDDNRSIGAWTIIIPVKDTTVAKTRLRGFTGPVRATLALAFALDSATAAMACRAVREVFVVTNDRDAALALSQIGVRVIRDVPEAGLNAALEHGAAAARREDGRVALAAMSADLPALRPEDLETAFAAGEALRRWFVADADGSGTTLLAAAEGSSLRPAFGAHSRDAHARSGASAIVGKDLQRLRRDVDTEEHLWEAVRLGVGQHTRCALADLALVASPQA